MKIDSFNSGPVSLVAVQVIAAISAIFAGRVIPGFSQLYFIYYPPTPLLVAGASIFACSIQLVSRNRSALLATCLYVAFLGLFVAVRELNGIAIMMNRAHPPDLDYTGNALTAGCSATLELSIGYVLVLTAFSLKWPGRPLWLIRPPTVKSKITASDSR